MLAHFQFAFEAVAPLVLLMALGYGLRFYGFLPRSFFSGGNKLMFRVLLPCALFCSIYSIESLSGVPWDVVLYTCAASLAVFALGWLTAGLLVKERPSRGAAIQCAFRSNIALIGLSLVNSIGGSGGAAVMSVVSGFSVPLFNCLAVTTLTLHREGGGRPGLRSLLREISRNPLILSCLLGIFAVALRTVLPEAAGGGPVFSLQRDLPWLYGAVEDLGGIATTFAMVVLGALLDFSDLGGKRKYIGFGVLWRLVLTPALGLGGAVLLCRLGLLQGDAAVFSTLIAYFGSPVAVSSAIMAAEMGADGELARQYVVWTSVGMVFTLPVWIVLLRSLGLL